MFWTGEGVLSDKTTNSEASKARDSYQRDLVLWDNYPVNDFARKRLFLGPLRDRPTDPTVLRGILINPMLQAIPSLIAIATAGEYADDPNGYDPEAAWQRALIRIAALTDSPVQHLTTLATAAGGWPPHGPRWPELETGLHSALGGDEDAALNVTTVGLTGHRLSNVGTQLGDSETWADWGATLAAVGELLTAVTELLQTTSDEVSEFSSESGDSEPEKSAITSDGADSSDAESGADQSGDAKLAARVAAARTARAQVAADERDVLRPQTLSFADQVLSAVNF